MTFAPESFCITRETLNLNIENLIDNFKNVLAKREVGNISYCILKWYGILLGDTVELGASMRLFLKPSNHIRHIRIT